MTDKNKQSASGGENKEEGLTEVLTEETKFYYPSAAMKENATVKDWDEAIHVAESDPEAFWAEAAEDLEWAEKWKKVLDDSKKPFYKWFVGSKCNIFQNALERHQKTAVKDKIAIISEQEGGRIQKLTYSELYQEVNKFAAALKKLGITKGDRVAVYLPNIPETAITMLACAKLGAIHSVVYAGFSYLALRDRINDAGAKLLVTANASQRRGKIVNLKKTCDKAVEEDCLSIEYMIVVKNVDQETIMKEGRDLWFKNITQNEKENVETEIVDGNDPLFVLYTSGTTSKPKGVVHDHAGYMVGVNRTFKWVFDLKEDDVY